MATIPNDYSGKENIAALTAAVMGDANILEGMPDDNGSGFAGMLEFIIAHADELTEYERQHPNMYENGVDWYVLCDKLAELLTIPDLSMNTRVELAVERAAY